MTDKNNAKTEADNKSSDLDNWITDLEDKEQPVACSIDDEDCEACGS